MTVILKDTVPPIFDVAELGYAAVAVYSLLYQSAIRISFMTSVSAFVAWIAAVQHIGHTKAWLTSLVWERKKLLNRLTLYLIVDLFNLLECCHLREEVGSACIV